ncbi:MAG: hypothetical protein F4X23_02390, partial [Gemmatimonadales bacterium]|nr:hypothetical protein [Gemmatimonadales bacterium]
MVKWHEWVGASGTAGRVRALATDDEAFDRAGALLDAGGVVAHPTSTVYGLGGRPRAEGAARRGPIKGGLLLTNDAAHDS